MPTDKRSRCDIILLIQGMKLIFYQNRLGLVRTLDSVGNSARRSAFSRFNDQYFDPLLVPDKTTDK